MPTQGCVRDDDLQWRDRRNSSSSNWNCHNRVHIDMWLQRYHFIVPGVLHHGYMPFKDDYMVWYLKITRLRIAPPEMRGPLRGFRSQAAENEYMASIKDFSGWNYRSVPPAIHMFLLSPIRLCSSSGDGPSDVPKPCDPEEAAPEDVLPQEEAAPEAQVPPPAEDQGGIYYPQFDLNAQFHNQFQGQYSGYGASFQDFGQFQQQQFPDFRQQFQDNQFQQQQ